MDNMFIIKNELFLELDLQSEFKNWTSNQSSLAYEMAHNFDNNFKTLKTIYRGIYSRHIQ